MRGARIIPKKLLWPVSLGLIILGAIIAIAAVSIAYGVLTKDVDTPRYNTLTPKGSSIESLGGWKRVSPPDSEPVFAYTDTIDNVTVSVSQQRLPEPFKKDTPAELAKLAKSYNATLKLEAGSTTAYVGASSKGPESAIFVKKSVLILIKSQAAVSEAAWTSYIESLE